MKILDANGRIEIWRENKLIAYVDESVLFAIDTKGYAIEICTINHRAEIVSRLTEYNVPNS